MPHRALILAVGLAAGLCTPSSAQAGLAGRWEGTIKIMGQELGIAVALTEQGQALTGTIDTAAWSWPSSASWTCRCPRRRTAP